MARVAGKTLRGSMPPKLINDVIRYVMAETGITQREMAAAIGKARANDVSSRLNSNNMTFDRAIEMLSVCGYEVVVQKRQDGKRADGQFVLVRSDAAGKGGGEG